MHLRIRTERRGLTIGGGRGYCWVLKRAVVGFPVSFNYFPSIFLKLEELK